MMNKKDMAEKIIIPITKEGRITIPKDLREKHDLKGYIEIIDIKDGITIKAH